MFGPIPCPCENKHPMEEIIKIVASALVGGGLWQIITWRLRKRKLENDTATEEFKQYEEILDSYLNRLNNMSETIVKLQEANIELRRQLFEQIKTKDNENDIRSTPG